jgi:transcriptional regulator with XRE-family HTH domain
MKEHGITQEQLAKEIGKNEATLNSKLNNKFQFKADEMDSICKVLDIPNEKISEYFFCTEGLENPNS